MAMSKILFIAATVVAIAVVATLVLTAPKQPGVDPAETSAVQTE
jgi:hypothetical protein